MSTTTTERPIGPEWGEVGVRLIQAFPQLSAADVLTELVQAHDAVRYVGTPQAEQYELVELMARYSLRVRTGEVTPSDRLDPERHASPRRD
jgi:hypothetical protein